MFDFINDVRIEIQQAFSAHWELNDSAHHQDHFESVFQTGLILKEKLQLWTFTDAELLFAAYFHDLFAWTRINHHDLAYEWMMTNNHPLITRYLNDASRRYVADACREHRASYRGNFSSRFSELVNSADRGIPGDVPGLIKRCYDHRLTTMPDASEDERMADAIKHLKHKSGSDGYARYPDMYIKVFGEELELQRQAIDKL